MRNSSRVLSWLASLSALALACGYGPHNDHLTSEGCPAGAEGCPCAEDDDCEGGLACAAGACQPGDGGSTTTGVTGSTTGPEMTTTSTTATTSEGVTTSATTIAATTGCEFICDTDMPGDGLQCDVFTQDCDDGQKCAAYDMDGDGAWDSTKCVDVMGDGQHGEPCTAEAGATGNDDCAEGVMCWNLNEEGVGTCIELCTGTPENPNCAPPNTNCVIVSGGYLNLCIPGCDPLLQDCVGSEVCIGDPNGDGFVCVLDASGGMAPEGTPCEFANTCNPGNMCVNPDFYPNPACQGSLGCCAPFCDLSDMNSCAGLSVVDAQCVPYHEPGTAPPGLEDVGVCGVDS